MYKKIVFLVVSCCLMSAAWAPPKFNAEGFLERPATPADMKKYLDDSMGVLEMGMRLLLDNRAVAPERVDLAARTVLAQFLLLQNFCMASEPALLADVSETFMVWAKLAQVRRSPEGSLELFLGRLRSLFDTILQKHSQEDAWVTVHKFTCTVVNLLETLKVELEDLLHTPRFGKVFVVDTAVEGAAEHKKGGAAGAGDDDAGSVRSMGRGLTELLEEAGAYVDSDAQRPLQVTGAGACAPVAYGRSAGAFGFASPGLAVVLGAPAPDYACFEPFLVKARKCVGVGSDADVEVFMAALLDAIHVFSVQLLIDSGRISLRDAPGSCAESSRFKVFEYFCNALKKYVKETPLYCDTRYSFIEDIDYIVSAALENFAIDYEKHAADYRHHKKNAKSAFLKERTDFVFARADIERDVSANIIPVFEWIMYNDPSAGLSLIQAFYDDVVVRFYGSKECDLVLKNAGTLLAVLRPEFDVDAALAAIESTSKKPKKKKKSKSSGSQNSSVTASPASSVSASSVSFVGVSDGSCSPPVSAAMGAGSGVPLLDLSPCRERGATQPVRRSLFEYADDLSVMDTSVNFSTEDYQAFIKFLENKKWCMSLKMIDHRLSDAVELYLENHSEDLFERIVMDCDAILAKLESFAKSSDYKRSSGSRDVYGSLNALFAHLLKYLTFEHEISECTSKDKALRVRSFYNHEHVGDEKLEPYLLRCMKGYSFKSSQVLASVKVRSLNSR